MNSLLAPNPTVNKGKAVGAVLTFLHATCGKPNPDAPNKVLWKGTVEEFRTGVGINADDSSVCPTTDVEMVELLHHARPLLRKRRFRLSPQRITTTSTIKVTSCPPTYKPAWERAMRQSAYR